MTLRTLATSLSALAGLGLATAAQAQEELRCPPLFVTDGDQVVCAVANYGNRDRDVTIEMRDGRDGALVEDVLDATLAQYQETGVHHNVVPPEGVAPAHPVICVVTTGNKDAVRASFARLADAAAPIDEVTGEPDFVATDAPNGGEMVWCK